ncbi:hypothetical protein FISHEDRAFT_59554 [Fistulina hepatica ATCC 64428]|uniref:CBM21 domain-containing protein n=1 Tax=Fistulina hepatica ATCC 64428 TaxID=1128425 RepID=A0A0D7A9S7_9AGAR|nr:hypothetical protein FISHEDRAFT_59554 [Fistulina hepatica ATCC 64428]
MPYSSPNLPSKTSPQPAGRTRHRRSWSIQGDPRFFQASSGPGAFSPLPALPRRTSKTKPPFMFHFHGSDDSDASDDTHDDTDARKSALTIDTAHLDAVPFPRQSPSPQALEPLLQLHMTPARPSVSRSNSHPVVLSKGKPLKSSLKPSSSSSDIASIPLHLRSRSAPSTPSLKNVHFAQRDAIRIFNRAARPSSVSLDNDTENTETETEIESQADRFPFAPNSLSSEGEPTPYEVDTDTSSRVPYVPNIHPLKFVDEDGAVFLPADDLSWARHIYIESIKLSPSVNTKDKEVAIAGTIIVRNVSFEKHVAIRFTLDDWRTTSEVVARYIESLPALPDNLQPTVVQELRVHAAQYSKPLSVLQAQSHRISPSFDRFAFAIRLGDYAHALSARTMWLVARYTAPGIGEWWDNNGSYCLAQLSQSRNYRINFRVSQQHAQMQLPAGTSIVSAGLSKASSDSQSTEGAVTSSIPSARPTKRARGYSAPSIFQASPMILLHPSSASPSAPELTADSAPLHLTNDCNVLSSGNSLTRLPDEDSLRRASETKRVLAARLSKLNLCNYARPSNLLTWMQAAAGGSILTPDWQCAPPMERDASTSSTISADSSVSLESSVTSLAPPPALDPSVAQESSSDEEEQPTPPLSPGAQHIDELRARVDSNDDLQSLIRDSTVGSSVPQTDHTQTKLNEVTVTEATVDVENGNEEGSADRVDVVVHSNVLHALAPSKAVRGGEEGRGRAVRDLVQSLLPSLLPSFVGLSSRDSGHVLKREERLDGTAMQVDEESDTADADAILQIPSPRKRTDSALIVRSAVPFVGHPARTKSEDVITGTPEDVSENATESTSTPLARSGTADLPSSTAYDAESLHVDPAASTSVVPFPSLASPTLETSHATSVASSVESLSDSPVANGALPVVSTPVVAPASQDSLYKAFLRQWCFNSGPTPAT